MDSLSAVIIDDVRLIRSELRTLLNDFPIIKVIGEAANVTEAIPMVEKLKPDIVFLDIHMPDLTGFEFLDRVNAQFKLIFISSFDKYLPQAQEYNPIDFLMKPINKKKLSDAIQKLI